MGNLDCWWKKFRNESRRDGWKQKIKPDINLRQNTDVVLRTSVWFCRLDNFHCLVELVAGRCVPFSSRYGSISVNSEHVQTLWLVAHCTKEIGISIKGNKKSVLKPARTRTYVITCCTNTETINHLHFLQFIISLHCTVKSPCFKLKHMCGKLYCPAAWKWVHSVWDAF